MYAVHRTPINIRSSHVYLVHWCVYTVQGLFKSGSPTPAEAYIRQPTVRSNSLPVTWNRAIPSEVFSLGAARCLRRIAVVVVATVPAEQQNAVLWVHESARPSESAVRHAVCRVSEKWPKSLVADAVDCGRHGSTGLQRHWAFGRVRPEWDFHFWRPTRASTKWGPSQNVEKRNVAHNITYYVRFLIFKKKKCLGLRGLKSRPRLRVTCCRSRSSFIRRRRRILVVISVL